MLFEINFDSVEKQSVKVSYSKFPPSTSPIEVTFANSTELENNII